MAQNVPIMLNENNAEDIQVSVTTNIPSVGTTLDLTGLTVEAYLKTAATTADTDSSTWKGSTASGEITVTNAPGGDLTVSVPGAAVSLTKAWWRVDVLSSGKRKTAAYGTVTVIAM